MLFSLLKVLFSGTEYGLIYVLQKCNNVYKISSDTLNYQLYNTNILLGGQMKWDLVVGSNNDSLMVEDFHITPINDNIPYDKKSEDYLLNYSHLVFQIQYHHFSTYALSFMHLLSLIYLPIF